MGQSPQNVFTQLLEQRVKQWNRPACWFPPLAFSKKSIFQKILKLFFILVISLCANDDVFLTYGYYFHSLKMLNVEDAHATLPSWQLWEQPVTFSCTCSMFFLFNDPQKYFYFTCLRQLAVARLKKEKKSNYKLSNG